MGFSGNRTMLWCSTTVALEPRMVPPPSPPPRPPPAAAPRPAALVYVMVTSASTFSLNGEMCSINERVASTPAAPRCWRALNSATSEVNSRVTSMTGPAGTTTLTPFKPGEYQGLLGTNFAPLQAPVGTYLLSGSGGAGFLTGLKWEFLRKAVSDVKYVICNADEGDPGAYMNRNEIESDPRSEEHTSELQSLRHLVCRLLLEKKKKK